MDSPRGEDEPVRVPPDDSARARRAIVVFAALAAAVLLVGGVIAGMSAARLDAGNSADRGWWWALLIGVPVLCLGGLAVGTVAAVRWQRRRRPGFLTSALAELPDRRARSALLRALRRGDPIPAEQRDVALRVAREHARMSWTVWLLPVVAAVWILNAIVQDGWGRVMYAVTAPVVVAASLYSAWLVRRMRTRALELEAGE